MKKKLGLSGFLKHRINLIVDLSDSIIENHGRAVLFIFTILWTAVVVFCLWMIVYGLRFLEALAK